MKARLVVVALLLMAGCTPTPMAEGVSNPFTVIDRFSAKALGLKHILAFAIGPENNVYVTDVSQQVAVISPDGEVLHRWGSFGGDPGEFRFVPLAPSDPFDIAARIAVGPDGKVYVIDPGNYRIQVFTSLGRYVGQIGSFGNADGEFVSASFVAVDHEGDLYVGDNALHAVSKFGPDGELLWRFGIADVPDFKEPSLALVDAHDRLVMPGINGSVVYVTGDGHVVDRFQTAACGEVTVDSLGNTYVNGDLYCGSGLTRVFDRRHQLIGEWSGPGNVLRSLPRFGTNGEAFALGPHGSLLRLEISLPGE